MTPQQFEKALKDVEEFLARPKDWRPPPLPSKPLQIPRYVEGQPDLIAEAEERWEIERENIMIHGWNR